MREITPGNGMVEDFDQEEVLAELKQAAFREEKKKEGILEDLEQVYEEHIQKKRRGWIPAVVIVIIVAAVYIGGCFVFHNLFFMPNTSINQVDASLKTVDAAKDLLTEDVENYTLTIKERNGEKEKISGADIDVKANLGGKVEEALHGQNAALWVVTAWHDKEIHLNDIAKYNKKKLNKQIKKLNCMDKTQMKVSRNATVSDTMTDGKFTIVKEVYGTIPIPDQVYDSINESVASLEDTVSLEKEGCYIDPKIKSDSKKVQKALEKVNSLTDFSITYEMKGTDPYVIDGDVMRRWIDVSSNLDVTFNEDEVYAFVEDFAKEHDTAFTERSFIDHAGETVTVPGGYYGWTLDQEAEKEELLAELKAQKDVTREPVWTSTAASLGEHEYGDTYVEVDLSRQTVYYMKDGEVAWECYCVTGKTSRGHGTTPGMYAVYYKQQNRILNGRNDDGSEYHTHVNYWMPFNGGQGLHDASWRGSFGGTIYVYSGSHGCVNLPSSRAAELYNMIEVGTPVIVYWSQV